MPTIVGILTFMSTINSMLIDFRMKNSILNPQDQVKHVQLQRLYYDTGFFDIIASLTIPELQ